MIAIREESSFVLFYNFGFENQFIVQPPNFRNGIRFHQIPLPSASDSGSSSSPSELLLNLLFRPGRIEKTRDEGAVRYVRCEQDTTSRRQGERQESSIFKQDTICKMEHIVDMRRKKE